MSEPDDDTEHAPLEELLHDLHATRGVDFRGYKRSSLRRRIRRRMDVLGIDRFDAYREYLRDQPPELALLLDSIFINVTSFFRDAEAWSFLAEHVVPELLGRARNGAPVRIWSAGCASGEEPFTVAMLFAEAVGLDELSRAVKIYATDLDEGALQLARRARYPLNALDKLPPTLRDAYFQIQGDEAVLDGALRRAVIFGQHDLVEDAPISRVDLLLCRNTTMYFNLETQSRILGRLHFALAERGYLFLGRAEMLLAHTGAFTPVELKHRIFTRRPIDRAAREVTRPAPARLTARSEPAEAARLREAALDASPVAQIVLDADRQVSLINHRASLMFRLGPADLGRPLQDLELSYRPTDLRSMLDEALAERRPVAKKDVEYKLGGRETEHLDVVVTPLFTDGEALATTLTFTNVTHHHKLQDNLQRFSENLETAYEELRSANEELETTNEEIQSANEELETTNEELQAANEEMETVNEELRSTNEQLSATNERLRQRERELDEANGFLRSILGGLRAGVAVLTRGLEVRMWNDVAAELWGVRREEAQGRSFAELDIGLPVGELLGPLRELLADGDGRATRELVVRAVNRRGRTMACRVSLSRVRVDGAESSVCVLMEDAGADPRADVAVGGGGGDQPEDAT